MFQHAGVNARDIGAAMKGFMSLHLESAGLLSSPEEEQDDPGLDGATRMRYWYCTAPNHCFTARLKAWWSSDTPFYERQHSAPPAEREVLQICAVLPSAEPPPAGRPHTFQPFKAHPEGSGGPDALDGSVVSQVRIVMSHSTCHHSVYASQVGVVGVHNAVDEVHLVSFRASADAYSCPRLPPLRRSPNVPIKHRNKRAMAAVVAIILA